jgi:hypothetical protein
MNENVIEVAACEEGVLSVLKHLRDGNIDEAVAGFAKSFRFNDRALGLEFTDKDRLREFFQKERELYPDASFQTRKILATGEHVVVEWLMEYSLNEPFYGNVSRKVHVSVHGVSIVRTRDRKVIEWSDYYDGLASRRTALTSYFTDWIEY